VGKRAFPTAAGELLLAHGVRARRELETAVERIQGLKGIVAGRLRIGTSGSISTYLLPPALGPSALGTRAPTSSSSPAMRRRSRARWWRATSTSAS
jgi:hypothetical protein